MRPLAQVFLVTEPSNSVDAVVVTSVDLFFRSKPTISTQGVEVQIRETLNGIPQSRHLPYASKVLPFSSIQTSTNASVSTRFTFDTPVILRTNEAFAIAVIPVGGAPGYGVWAAKRDAADATDNSKIVLPNNIGNLFGPSNDLTYTMLDNEALKFSIVTANFTQTSGTAIYRPDNLEFFNTRPITGSFATNERVFVANNNLKLASLSVAATFTNNEIVVQPNTATNTSTATAYGTVYFSNGTVTRLRDTVGKFSTTGSGLRGLTSAVTTANATVALTNTSTASSNVITVPVVSTPDDDFVVNSFIYVATSSLSDVQLAKITAVNATSRQVSLDTALNFTDTDAIYGRVKSDGNLYGYCNIIRTTTDSALVGLSKSSANSTQNFANMSGQYLIGSTTGSTAVIDRLTNIAYDALTPQLASIASKESNTSFSFSGYNYAGSADASNTEIFSDIPYEFIDRQRTIFSKSNELTSLSGSKSLTINANLSTDNQKFSPYLDSIRKVVVLTSNQILPEAGLEGFYLSLGTSNGTFSRGDLVWQSNATSNTTGQVTFANSTFITVSNVSTTNTQQIALFNANSTSVINSLTVTANVVSTRRFNEALGNGSKTPSRYISKTVLLADEQDAEDLAVFLSAYRPQGTDIKVYGKLLNGSDSDPFDDKSWTPMMESSNGVLTSSLVDREDYIELKYELPSSTLVHSSNISVSTTSDVVNFTSGKTTELFQPGMFVYVTDTIARTFAVRRVMSIQNSTSMTVSSNLTFTSTNSAVGYIDGSLAQCNAFRYTENNGIVRYVCNSSDSVYDSFKSFAVKIVLTSDVTQIIPKVADMRALALQI
jgi:hypothetical protein